MHARSFLLRNYLVDRLEKRRKWRGLSRGALLARFIAALEAEGHHQSLPAAKRRLDRVLSRAQRRPLSEATRRSLASALDLTILELEKLLGLPRKGAEAEVRALLFQKPQASAPRAPRAPRHAG
ncbi:MAG TPA: hypothetical protein VGG02_03365 [Chthoniobacterales bacterium]